jgi:hypothetical protein
MFNIAIPRLAARKLARVALAFILACAVMGALADVSSAAWKKLPTIGKGELEAKCIANGGVYSQGDTGAGSYSCVGSGGVVTCNSKGQCKGGCPKCASVVKGSGIGGILHPTGSAGTASATGGTASNKKPLHNVNRPIMVQHSGGTRSGGSKH